MSRQIQIRRGTAAEHANFTGAIGEVTMDTTNKTLRVHDGTTTGGTILAKQSEIPDLTAADYVITSQLPTAENNYTWYRKYKSGWIEQGQRQTTSEYGSNGTTVTLPVEMADTKYQVLVTQVTPRRDGIASTVFTGGYAISSTQIFIAGRYAAGSPESVFLSWEVKGVAA